MNEWAYPNLKKLFLGESAFPQVGQRIKRRSDVTYQIHFFQGQGHFKNRLKISNFFFMKGGILLFLVRWSKNLVRILAKKILFISKIFSENEEPRSLWFMVLGSFGVFISKNLERFDRKNYYNFQNLQESKKKPFSSLIIFLQQPKIRLFYFLSLMKMFL